MKKYLISLLGLLILSSCVETVVAGIATSGYLVMKEEKVSETIEDISIKQQIKSHIRDRKKSDKKLKTEIKDVRIDVVEDRVLLTGTVRNRKIKEKVYNLVWDSSREIKEVINELHIVRGRSRNKFKDGMLASQVKMKFRAKKRIKSINYEVATVDGVVYLLGIARDHSEMDLAAKTASRVKGVKNVVSHVVLKHDRRRMAYN